MSEPPRVGDIYHFRYDRESQFNCDLEVTEVVTAVHGSDPDPLVMFNDGTHSRLRHIRDVPFTRKAYT